MLKGINVILYDKVQSGKDAFNKPTYTETAITVSNVLVAPTTATDVIDITSLNGKKAVYTLAIPKGDTHTWEDKKVEFFGETWHTFGYTVKALKI